MAERKPCTLYGETFKSKAEAMRHFDIKDYQTYNRHKKASDAGQTYAPVVKKRGVKWQRMAKKMIALGFTNWVKED